MTQPGDAINVAPATGGGLTLVPAWQRRYWRWQRRGRAAVREWSLARRLRGLRRRALATPRHQPGTLKLDGYHLRYDDLLSLYIEYKHIFGWGIYDFRPQSPQPLVLDGGSHLGVSVLRFKRIAPGCRVIAFEPDPPVLELLRDNIHRNELSGVEVVPAALAGARGRARFVPDGADGGALLCSGLATPGAGTVATVPLSDYLAGPVDLLKLNIEGAEHEVLCEAADQLHNVRQMVIEYHGLPECGQRLHEILALLDECGFRYLVHHFDYESNGAVQPPFRIDHRTRFFELIAAQRLRDGGRARVRRVPCRAASGEDVRGLPVAERCAPLSRQFGLERGRPIDRCFIEDFLNRHRDDVRGCVLEIGDNEYTRRIGGGRVTRSDVLNPSPAPGTTVVADLAQAHHVPDQTYDCFILTQTLLCLFDVRAALRSAQRSLKPGGVLLITVPGISQISRYDAQRWGDFWRFTPQGVRRLLEERFAPQDVSVTTYGNLRTAVAFLEGRAAHELQADELEYVDEDFPVTTAARAVRRA